MKYLIINNFEFLKNDLTLFLNRNLNYYPHSTFIISNLPVFSSTHSGTLLLYSFTI